MDLPILNILDKWNHATGDICVWLLLRIIYLKLSYVVAGVSFSFVFMVESYSIVCVDLPIHRQVNKYVPFWVGFFHSRLCPCHSSMPSCVRRPRFSLLCDIPSCEHCVYYQRPVAGHLESFHFATVRSEAPVNILVRAFRCPYFSWL